MSFMATQLRDAHGDANHLVLPASPKRNATSPLTCCAFSHADLGPFEPRHRAVSSVDLLPSWGVVFSVARHENPLLEFREMSALAVDGVANRQWLSR